MKNTATLTASTTGSIWHGTPSLESANERGAGVLIGRLGMELSELGVDYLVGRMPVDPRTRQPAGVLHGGASVAFAETLASWAGSFAVDRSRFHCVGMEINANHIRPAASGWVTGVARPVNIGRTTQVWDVRITTESGKLVCIARCTLAVLVVPSAYAVEDLRPTPSQGEEAPGPGLSVPVKVSRPVPDASSNLATIQPPPRSPS